MSISVFLFVLCFILILNSNTAHLQIDPNPTFSAKNGIGIGKRGTIQINVDVQMRKFFLEIVHKKQKDNHILKFLVLT